jgi:TonB family protein
MRALLLAIAMLTLVGCSSTPAVKEDAQPTTPAITVLDNPSVIYDKASVPEVEMDNQTENLPKVINKPNPHFPEIALRAGLQGNVFVRILIAPNGSVRTAKILQTDAAIFNQPSLEAALKWTFEPPMVDGKSAAVWVKVPFRFAISKSQ